MRFDKLSHVLITILLLQVLGVAHAQNLLNVKTFTLRNGMTVWLNEDNTQPKVFGAVVVKAGAKDCPNTGIAHYLEHLLFKGTQQIGTVDYKVEKPWLDSISAQYDLLAKTADAHRRLAIQRHINELSIKAADYAIPNEFSNLISLYGGTGLNAYTSFDETVFHNTFSPQYLRQWCELNAERLRDPVFRLFQGELETVYEEKNMYTDNLLAFTAEKAQQIALAGTPYAYPILGATDSLKNPRLSEMMKFFRTYYVPENMGLILVGSLFPTPSPKESGVDTPLDSLKSLLERTFGQLEVEPNMPIRHSMPTKLNIPKEELRLKLPIPIVKIGGFAWQTPDEHSKDYAAFKVMSSMLTNDDKTGLIDSLMTNGKMLFAMGLGYNFKDFSAWGFGFVPNLPFGSRKKAERLCFEQIDKLKRGQFSDAALDAEKLTLSRNMELDLETVNGRSKAMINAFSHGLSWDDVVGEGKALAGVSREDIMRVARKYIGDDSVKIVKKFGHYRKEHVSQPGYKPVQPKNAGAQSDYAKELAKLPTSNAEPRLIDINKDAQCTRLSQLVNLYTVHNPENDVFSLKIIYRRSYRNDSRLSVLADYLNDIGTVEHDKHSFGQLLRRQGATIEADASANDFIITLTGLDNRFKESMQLLHEFLTQPKADEKALKKEVKSLRLEKATFFKDNRSIANAVMQKVERGDDSYYLSRVSAKELGKMSGRELVSLFHDLQLWQTDIVYCGRQDAKDIESNVKSCIDINKVSHAWQPAKKPLKGVGENVVYVYDNPSARQTVVGAYQQIAPMPTAADRARLLLWGNYFGGGMQSVTFQEIREFRSLAYYAHGSALVPDLQMEGKDPCGYVTLAGTQADKAMQTVELIDSLISNMPLREANIAPARQSLISSINNSYPSFRAIGSNVAHLRLLGYSHDPDGDLAEDLPKLGITDVESFYKQNVQSRPRALIVVGNKKTLDMEKLAKLGKVVMLKKKDIYK